MTDVSVIVCTHRIERWQWLVECLASVQAQSLTPRMVVVVVDGSRTIEERLIERGGPELILTTTAPSGLSAARNLGLDHVDGEFIAFLDDDAVADRDWLSALRVVLNDPAVAGASGLSLPVWARERPPWMPDELLWTVGCSYRGMPVERSVVRNVYGGCACIRREVFRECGGFDTRLGRRMRGLAGGEETDLCLRVSRLMPETRFVHEPAAVIYHHVPQERQRLRYVVARCVAEGRSKAILHRIGPHHTLALDRERLFLTRTLPAGVARDLRAAARGDAWSLARAGTIVVGTISTVGAFCLAIMAGIIVRRKEGDADREQPMPPFEGEAPLSAGRRGLH